MIIHELNVTFYWVIEVFRNEKKNILRMPCDTKNMKTWNLELALPVYGWDRGINRALPAISELSIQNKNLYRLLKIKEAAIQI